LEPTAFVSAYELLSTNSPLPPWSFDLVITYPDRMYLRVGERYRPLPKNLGGGGRLQHFSYHYGPDNGEKDEDGFPKRIDECVLRIDIDWHSKHAHYGGEDHIAECRLRGLNFSDITPFEFIRAIEEHRKTSKPLHEILGFEVLPAK
jgi:hypothetical protein